MGVNKRRTGAVRNRIQRYSTHHKKWVKYNAATGEVISIKATPGPYRGIRKI